MFDAEIWKSIGLFASGIISLKEPVCSAFNEYIVKKSLSLVKSDGRIHRVRKSQAQKRAVDDSVGYQNKVP